LDSWVAACRKVTFVCRGLLLRHLRIWISVSTLVGMRFMMSISRGRMSWVSARVWLITKMFSEPRTE